MERLLGTRQLLAALLYLLHPSSRPPQNRARGMRIRSCSGQ